MGWKLISALSCVTLGKVLDPSMAQFPHLHNWDITDPYLTGLLGVLIEPVPIKS